MTSPFAEFAVSVLDRWLATHPVEATFLGDHTHDHELPDPSPAATNDRAAEVRAQLAQLDANTPGPLDERVDAEVLRTTLTAELLDLTELDTASWDAMLHNPGNALHALASRPFAPAADRLDSVRARLAAVPTYLAAARDRLTTLSRIHTETALQQLDGTLALIDTELPGLAADAGSALGDDADRARDAVAEHQDWLRRRLERADRSPRLGAEAYRVKLALVLDTEFDPASLLARAEHDLDRLNAEIVAVAGDLAGVPRPDSTTARAVLDELAGDAATDATILDLCRAALAETTAFVRAHELVTVYDDAIEVIEMPEIDRGVAGAYCNPAGPLERTPLPTQFAVSPTPKDWTVERIASYYRENNAHMLHNLTVHEAMPGHALQLMHSNRHDASTPIRAVFGSGTFIEGWAVYAEELMATHGYREEVSPRAASALRMQQLKMQLRSTLNAILDIRFHCHDLDEAAAMSLMTERGYQEPSEASNKWRRVQLTSTQLCEYYVGYCEVRDLAADLRAVRPTHPDRAVHDAMLAHGSPPVRHLRSLLLG